MSSSRSSFADILVLLLLVAGCVVGLMAVWKIRFQNKKPLPQTAVRTVPNSKPLKTILTPPPKPTPPVIVASTSTPPGMLCDTERVICVNQSYEGQLFANPFSVTGTVYGSARELFWSLEDAAGTSLVNGNVSVTGTQTQGEFALRSFILTKASSSAATLVLSRVAKTDAPTLRLPVRLSQKTTAVTLYHVDRKDEPKDDGYTCPDAPRTTRVEKRNIVETKLPVEATLRAYLEAPSEGIHTFSVQNGTASIVFKEGMLGALDACLLRLTRASIEKTLQQFSTVERVTMTFATNK